MELRLNEAAIQLIKNNKKLRVKITAAIGVTDQTIVKCLANNDIRLTALDSLHLITEEYNEPVTNFINGNISKLLLA